MVRWPIAMIVWASLSVTQTIAADALSPRADRLAIEERMEAEYRAARERCNALNGNAQDVCLAEAKAKLRIERSEADARVKNTPRARYDAQIARAEAEFQVAKERCVERGGAKESCVREAQETEARAKAEANAAWRAAENQKER